MIDHEPNQALHEDVGELLRELINLIVHRSAGDMFAIMSSIGLSLPQLVALQRLESFGPASISGIAAGLNLSMAATSHLVDRLVQLDLVARSENQHDRRHKRVVITDAGLDLLNSIAQTRVREVNQSVAVLHPDQRLHLSHVLRSVVNALRAAPAPAVRSPCQK
jgi:DNA-binding MarR family transcriptional regulator